MEWDEIISLMDIVSRKITNNIATNVTKDCYSKKARYKFNCYIVLTVLLVIILVLIIGIICCHYGGHSSKQKHIDAITM